jgi:hypothetical protein
MTTKRSSFSMARTIRRAARSALAVSKGSEARSVKMLASAYRFPFTSAWPNEPVRMRPGTTVTTRTPWRMDSRRAPDQPRSANFAAAYGRGAEPDGGADRRDVNDRPAAALAHPGQDRLGRVEGAPEHHVHRAPVVVRLHRLDRPDLDDARVVHEDVDRAHVLLDVGDEPLDPVLVGHVARQRGDVDPLARQAAARSLELLLVARADDDPHPAAPQLARDDEAEPARAACDERDLAGSRTLRAPRERQRDGSARDSERGPGLESAHFGSPFKPKHAHAAPGPPPPGAGPARWCTDRAAERAIGSPACGCRRGSARFGPQERCAVGGACFAVAAARPGRRP